MAIDKSYIAHHVPGRLRLKVPRARGDRARLQHIDQSLARLTGVRNVDVDSLTGSVLIHYDAADQHDIVNRVRDKGAQDGLFSLELPDISPFNDAEQKIEAEAEFLAEHSRLAASLVELVRGLNAEIRRLTDNNLDLNVLLPLALGGYSLTYPDADLATPLWVTLGLASINSFIALHATAITSPTGTARPQPAAPAARKAVPTRRGDSR